MITNFEKVDALVQQSDLSEGDKDIFIETLADAKEEDLAELATLFKEDREWIAILSANYKQKRIAVINGDPIMWRQIIEEERQLLMKRVENNLIGGVSA